MVFFSFAVLVPIVFSSHCSVYVKKSVAAQQVAEASEVGLAIVFCNVTPNDHNPHGLPNARPQRDNVRRTACR